MPEDRSRPARDDEAKAEVRKQERKEPGAKMSRSVKDVAEELAKRYREAHPEEFEEGGESAEQKPKEPGPVSQPLEAA